MTPRQIMQLPDGRLIGFHRNLPPFEAESLKWWRYPKLVSRKGLPPPTLPTLPALPEEDTGEEPPGVPPHEPDGRPETWQALFPNLEPKEMTPPTGVKAGRAGGVVVTNEATKDRLDMI